MKKIYLLLLLVCTTLFAQVPQGFSYQAVALNSSGAAVASAPVRVRLSILENSATGNASYVETHNPTTNNVGLFTLTIGMGTPTTGTFANINWAQNAKFLKVELDVTNGTNYVTIGASQLLSVPYAMYAGGVAGIGSGNGSGTGASFSSLYMCGTFNSFNPATAVEMQGDSSFRCFKYLTAGSQIKFTPSTTSTVLYGKGTENNLAANATGFAIQSNGIYAIEVYTQGTDQNGNRIYSVNIENISVRVQPNSYFFNGDIPMTYNAATNTLSCTVTNVYSSTDLEARFRNFQFIIGNYYYGDNLTDGSIDDGNASEIPFPASTTTRSYRITLNLNSTGIGSPYTVTAQ
ncbi:hypothetical protein ACLI08_02945 [Flavobacterium sp. RNTU_13]|uniref:hypothetical protein n=1 Tax=Flavobacterium sp. RNTU_13 TaxID=3375145 RepID=UPI0039872C6D